jgi:hypothetical protein
VTILEQALSLASRGFYVFPLRRNGKLPSHKGWQEEATRDPETITKLWGKRLFNVGISTSKFGDGAQALCVVDVDTKEDKHGDQTLLELELQGLEFPTTLEHSTPSGGRHIIYLVDQPLRQGTDVLGKGLDIRSRGGLIVAPGSTIDGKEYQQINGYSVLAQAPEWLVSRLGMDRGHDPVEHVPLRGIDPVRAAERAVAWLKDAPAAVEGDSGDNRTYATAARVKDFGCSQDQTLWLMDEHWNPRCDPPWTLEELGQKVANAFKHGREPQGIDAPEAIFEPVPKPEEDGDPKGQPFAEINKEYAFIKNGAFVLQETTDEEGNFVTERLPVADFHAWFSNRPWTKAQEKARPISMHWMEWTGRRQYDGVVFSPEMDLGPRWYNLWRGFSVAPVEKAHHPALDAFLEHALKNVCNGDESLFHWLMGYFAHMIQKPWEKPLVALVMKGQKGTGKNALLERVGWLLGNHFLVADDDRYLLSNFNAHLERTLFFVLDEAAWAGDKKAEGKLKGLITGQKNLIEHKNKEPRAKKNLIRVAIIGNEDWLVPATQDERRFAVFNVGEGRMQDRAFFIGMREGMEQGGYAHLLRYLLDFDLSGVDVNDAPKTQALVEQKLASLGTVEQWWLDCLSSGQIAGGDWGGEWPGAVPTNRMRAALSRWAKERNIRSRLPEEVGFGRLLHKLAPHFKKKKARPDLPLDTSYSFFLPLGGMAELRRDWESFLGAVMQWD